MKVLFINETCGRGSHGKICTSLMDILHSEGHEAMTAYGRESVSELYEPYAIRVGNKWDVCIHALGSRLFDNTGFYSRSATQKLISQIIAFNPDIIHLHNIHGYYIHIEELFRYLSSCGKKIIWTLHDSWAYTGHCTCSDFIGCKKWKNGCYQCPQTKNYPSSLFIDRSAKNYEIKKELFTAVQDMRIVTPSEWLKREVQQSFLGTYPVTVIRSGIDLGTFQPTNGVFRQKYGLEDKKVLLSVANAWSQRKGLDLLNNLAKNLTEDTKLVLVGNLRGETVCENILTIDHTSNQEELAEIYSAADVYLNLSYEETQGLTTTEALACGTPAVVSNRTAIPESVNASCGVVVEQETTETILAAISRAESLRAEDCVRFAQKYDKNLCFKKYLEMYKEIAGNDKF